MDDSSGEMTLTEEEENPKDKKVREALMMWEEETPPEQRERLIPFVQNVRNTCVRFQLRVKMD